MISGAFIAMNTAVLQAAAIGIVACISVFSAVMTVVVLCNCYLATTLKLFGKNTTGIVKEIQNGSDDNTCKAVVVEYRSCGKLCTFKEKLLSWQSERRFEIGQSVEVLHFLNGEHCRMLKSVESWVEVLVAWPLFAFLLFDLVILCWIAIFKIWDEVEPEGQTNIMVVYAITGVFFCLVGSCVAYSYCCEDSSITDKDVIEMNTIKSDIPTKSAKDIEITPLLELPDGSGDQAQ